MIALLGLVLVLLGIFGLLGLLGLGVPVSVVCIIIGVVLIAYDRGALRR